MDTPLIVQFFNLGGEVLLFGLFIRFLDVGPIHRRQKAAKRTVWLRRYGIVSLSIYSVGSLVGKGIFWVLEKLFGPAIDLTGDPHFNWNVFAIYGFILAVFLAWEIILRLWEKAHFILSLEWMLVWIFRLLRFKSKADLHIDTRLYQPTLIEFYEGLKKSDLLPES